MQEKKRNFLNKSIFISLRLETCKENTKRTKKKMEKKKHIKGHHSHKRGSTIYRLLFELGLNNNPNPFYLTI